jgi:hypothetical protein
VKVLILSWYFPPVNTIGALRVGKFARFLLERGHDVGVVAGSKWGAPETLPLGVPLTRITYARPFDVNAVPNWIQRQLRRPKPPATTSAPELHSADDRPQSQHKSALRQLSDLYLLVTNIPDNRIGWLPAANVACRRMCRDWRPDLIFASGPPFTAFLAARHISERVRVPWVAELRDRWADDPYDDSPRWRHALDERLERRILKTARGLVTVTEPWAEFYRHKYESRVVTIYNGFDPRDFARPELDPAPPENPHLVIGYTGGIYPGRRDPTPLFQALRLLGEAGEDIRVVFCGTNPAHVYPLADRASVRHLVEVRPPVPHRQSLEFQRQADVLLLMQWNDPREQGNCPGKFFEYLGSLRPVLILGLEDGVPASIVRQRTAGFCLNDPGMIAAQLRAWLREKREFGRVRALPEVTREGLSRDVQFAQLEKFLTEMRRGT